MCSEVGCLILVAFFALAAIVWFVEECILVRAAATSAKTISVVGLLLSQCLILNLHQPNQTSLERIAEIISEFDPQLNLAVALATIFSPLIAALIILYDMKNDPARFAAARAELEMPFDLWIEKLKKENGPQQP